MKIFKSIITIFALTVGVFSQSCHSQAQNRVYGNIGYEGAKVYSDATGKQATDKTMGYGEIVEFDSTDKGPYVKVTNIATGVNGYVKTVDINEANYPLEAPYIFDNEQSECGLLNIETGNNGEITSGWTFWKHGDGVMALNSITLAYNNGRVVTRENYYLGTAHPGYIILTESIQYGDESGEKLETPIVIYEDIASRAGIFEGGKCFTPGGQLGGFDTDDWD